MHSSLIRQINNTLRRQGYTISHGTFLLAQDGRENLRRTHAFAKKERIVDQYAFIHDQHAFIRDHMIDGRDLVVHNMAPILIPVTPGSRWATLFRWWNHVWWSVPYEPAYGRQMRYVVWDHHHKAVIGLIGLHSPILSWAPRDRYLGIGKADRDYWVNQSMSAQRLGAVPPYHLVLGGKLVAMLLCSDTVRRDFHAKYSTRTTSLQGRTLPANLLFATTTGAFGKSSLYTRLKLHNDWLATFIGYSHGSGSFHIPNAIYEHLLAVLDRRGVEVTRGYGHGPSRKMRLIRKGMELLGYKNGVSHGVKRAVYLFPFAKNLHHLISGHHHHPIWHHRQEDDLTDFWKHRWSLPRIAAREKQLRSFTKKQFIREYIKEAGRL